MNFLVTGTDKLAAQKDFKLVGRDADLERLTAVLLRNKSNSVLLMGPGGVGLSAMCLGLQASKDKPDAPFDVVSKRYFWLETDALFSSGNSEVITAHFNKVMDTLRRTPDSVLVIEDARDFIEAARANGLGNFINSLNNAVRTGKTQVIFEVRDEDLDVVLKAHSDMRECYTLMDLTEPARDALREIVQGQARSLSDHHGIRITEDAVEAAIELTTKYRTRDLGLSRAQPERSVTLLDRALSTFRLHAHKQHPLRGRLLATKGQDWAQTPEGVAELGRLDAEFSTHQSKVRELYNDQREADAHIVKLEDEIEQRIADENERRKAREAAGAPEVEDSPTAGSRIRSMNQRLSKAGLESAEVVALREKVRQFQSLLQTRRQEFKAITSAFNDSLEVGRDTVVDQFSLISGISASKLNQDERKKLRTLEASLKERVFGQDDACEKLANAIKVAKAGRRKTGKPIASFMFMGPSGVGKTELSKALTHCVLDDAAAMTRFDMSEFMEKHAVAKLIGAPPGYEGFEAGGILTNAMRQNPVRVLLFDEIEKAHPDVFNIFLQILSDSRLTDNVGRVVSFDDAIILMTTNIGQSDFLNPDLNNEEATERAKVVLDQTYRPEFLNRFNGRENIVSFRRLGPIELAKIVRRELNEIGSKYDGITLIVPDATVAEFVEHTYDPTKGARGPVGYVNAKLEPVLANLVIENEDFQGTVVVGYDPAKGGFTTQVVAPAPEPIVAAPAAVAAVAVTEGVEDTPPRQKFRM